MELQKQVYVKPAGTDGNGTWKGVSWHNTQFCGLIQKLVANPEEAEQVKLMFEMYVEPKTSYGDIVRHFAEHGIKDFSRPALAIILCNPIYVKADLDIYEFFESQRTVIVNDAADALIFGGILTSICT